MESASFHHDHAMLEWQIELGATEAISDVPVNRYDVPAVVEKPKVAEVAAGGFVPMAKEDPVALANKAAAGAGTLEELRSAMAAFDHCDLKKGARNLVFSDGIAGASVMLIGDAPTRAEDQAGTPFVGKEGQLLDKMLGAIGMGRANAAAPVYLTSILPWRPPQNRDPKPHEIAMMKPFLLRHIELAAPKVLVLVGNWACQALLEKRGIARLRGQWTQVAGIPALPLFHPSHLMRSPEFKRETWADLLSLQKRLKNG
jgi:DNA polymerase